jgi:hypothetical protein
MAAVAAAVLGEDLLDDQAVVGEPGLGSKEEVGRGLAGLIRVDLGIGQPGVVVDRGVNEPIAADRVMPGIEAAT